MGFFKKFLIFAWMIFAVGCVVSIQADLHANDEYIFEEAFVAYATEDFFPYMEILLDSIKAFSKRPIVVFGLNADIPFSSNKYPFMTKKRIDIHPLSRENIMFTKPKIILQSKIRRGIYVDADMILNQGCDELFTHHEAITNYPLCPIFVFDPNNQSSVMDAMGVVRKTMHYVQAQLIFSEKCHQFLKEWESSCITYRELAKHADHDETVLNVLLWKYGATDSIRIWEPFYNLAYDYLNESFDMHYKYGYINFINKIDFYMFHGCKNVNESNMILKFLIEKARYNSLSNKSSNFLKRQIKKKLSKG